MPKSDVMYEVKADRRGGVYLTDDRQRAEEFAVARGAQVKIHAPSLSTASA